MLEKFEQVTVDLFTMSLESLGAISSAEGSNFRVLREGFRNPLQNTQELLEKGREVACQLEGVFVNVQVQQTLWLQ